VLVLTRYRVADTESASFAAKADAALTALSARTGFVDGQVARNVDDPQLWTLTTRWDGVGSYRRALSAYEVKTTAVPLLSRAIDEPTAYEVTSTR
jgi:heme-degrading monooxygenase HmoA